MCKRKKGNNRNVGKFEGIEIEKIWRVCVCVWEREREKEREILKTLSYFCKLFQTIKIFKQFKLFPKIQMFSYFSTNFDFYYLCLPLFKWCISAQILCLLNQNFFWPEIFSAKTFALVWNKSWTLIFFVSNLNARTKANSICFPILTQARLTC